MAEWVRCFVESNGSTVSVDEILNMEHRETAMAFSHFREAGRRHSRETVEIGDPEAQPRSKRIKRDDDDDAKKNVPPTRVLPGTLSAGIENVLAWATRVDEYEHNDKIEMKIHAVWNLTRHLDAAKRLDGLQDLRHVCERTYVKEFDEKTETKKFKKKKRLAWAVAWIDEMIANVRDGEPFDDTLNWNRY